MAFSAEAVEAGAYIRDNTEEHSVFLTGTQHLNPVDSIAGRRIVCGPDLWLYWHGFNTRNRQYEIQQFFEDPENHPEIPQKYGVSYIYVSSYERSSYDVDEEGLDGGNLLKKGAFKKFLPGRDYRKRRTNQKKMLLFKKVGL